MKLFFIICLLLQSICFANESEFFPLFSHIQTDEFIVALTFDDGPHPLYTAEILDILNDYNVKATFFLVGYNVRLYDEIVLDIAGNHHDIGNHSYTHEAYSQMEDEDILIDLARSQKLFKETLGYYPRYFRPPFGRLKESQATLISPYFEKLVKWSLDPKDWEKGAKSGSILVSILKDVKPGSIILLHSDKRETVKMLPSLLENLLHRGVQFATISELITHEQGEDYGR
jgi:peptidoglycan-N-acetylglucosamine deacetylase